MDAIAKKREEIREDAAQRRRLELREQLLKMRTIIIKDDFSTHEYVAIPDGKVNYGRINSRHKTPYAFLKAANNFTNFINQHFVYGERFPVKSYMKSIYDQIDERLCWPEYIVLDYNTGDNEYYSGREIRILAFDKEHKSIIQEHDYDKVSYDTIESFAVRNRMLSIFNVDGCIQYLHFSEFAETFMHSFVLTSLSELYSIIREPKDYKGTGLITRSLHVNEQQVVTVLEKYKSDDDFIPSVIMNDDNCIIEWIEYRPCNGISKCKYEIYKNDDAFVSRLNYKLISRESILELKEKSTLPPIIID